MNTSPVAPALGRLAAPPRGRPHDPTRLALVDQIVALNSRERLDGDAWLAAWEQAARALRDHVIAEAEARIDRAAARSRYPAGRLAEARPDADAADSLLNRLLAEGAALERMAGPERDDALTRMRGAELEAAWGAAVRLADAELMHWTGVARDIENWRRPWRPFVIIAAVLLSLAVVIAALLGGLVPAPGWFTPVSDWFWSLPWPW